MNPELERALVEYHHRHRSRDLLLTALSLAFVLIAVLDIVITHHVRTRPLISFGVVGVLGLLFAMYMRSLHRPVLLDRLRTGIAIRDVRRGAADRAKERATIYVDFADGLTASLVCLNKEDQQSHIEELLRSQMAR